MNTYLPLSDYGLIGDCHTAALISNRGSVDWMCAPHFDSPSIFARLLDSESGGFFSIRPAAGFESHMEYIPDTGVLRTRFQTESGSIDVTDFMPLRPGDEPLPWARPRASGRLVRLLEGVQGTVCVAVHFEPRPDYARTTPRLAAFTGGLTSDDSGGVRRLYTDIPLVVEGPAASGVVNLRSGEQRALVFTLEAQAGPAPPQESRSAAADDLQDTLAFWRAWCVRCNYRGPYEHAVMRSALTLKMLSYAPTGAMVAAPTTSLPEEIGGVRNWDYRYTWIRDASFAAYALLTGGHIEDGINFFDWVCAIALRHGAGDLQIMYGIRGETRLDEYILDHLEGYRHSRPVRIGNAASDQAQLDVYGELLDCFHTYRRLRNIPASELQHLWPAFRAQIDHVAGHWREPDSGIWEVRSAPRHFVYSKVMAWAALDRGIKAAEELGWEADVARWKLERTAVRADVLEKGYNAEIGSFTQSYGDRVLDAANLLLPVTGFLDAADERMASTIDRTSRDLAVDGLVYRYRGADDGLAGNEAAFAACTFWLVEALAALGRDKEATELFEQMLARANPLGLFAEEIDPRSGAHAGNFPQALTHIALMNAAVTLARAKSPDDYPPKQCK